MTIQLFRTRLTKQIGAAFAGAALFAVATTSVATNIARAEVVPLVKVDIVVVAKGYRASKLLGRSIVNDKNESIGTLEDLMIDKKEALVAILQVGGFLGLGGRLVAVPYKSLVFDDAKKEIKLPGATKEALQKLADFQYIP